MGLFRTHTVTTRANKISNFSVATAEYGAVVPEVLGTTRISGNIIDYGDFTAHEHKETHKSGKGGGVKSVNITYTYTVAAIIALCEGEIVGVKRIWNGKDIYYGTAGVGLTEYRGAKGQQPWPYNIQHHKEKALPYEGLAYVAGVIDLGDSAAFPSFNFEITGNRKLAETSGDGTDVNPADYIRYILDKVGLKGVKIDGLENYKKYCQATDLLISTPMDDVGQTKEAQAIINEIMQLTNAYMFWSNDHYKVVVIDDEAVGGWVPNKAITYDLTPADFIPQDDGSCITYQRKNRAEIYNQFPVEFTNRANGYEKETVNFEILEDISDYGLRQAPVTSAGYIYTKERAVKVAKNIAKRNQIEKDQYTFQLDWAFCRLEPGDLVRITDEDAGIVNKVVAVTSVTEDNSGLYTITAVSRKEGNYTSPKYDVHDTERPYLDTNKEPDDTEPVIFQPPVDLTDNGLEVWLGVRGKGSNWGGCVVYASDDNTNYREIGQMAASARFGKLLGELDKDGTSVHVSCNDALIAGTKQDAERSNTLIWIDGECMSYQGAELQLDGTWVLSGLIRGQLETPQTAHAEGSQFVRCDATLFHVPFDKRDIGKTVYLKFCAVNMFGYALQDLSDVEPYEYILTPYYLPPVNNLRAYNRYRELSDGVSRYDVVVEWDKPALDSFLQGEVWYKTNSGMTQRLTYVQDMAAKDMGFASEWQYAGSGETKVVIPQAVLGDTYRICVVTKDIYGAMNSRDSSPSVDITVAMKTTTPNTPAGFTVAFDKTAIATWEEVTNSDIAWYEVRTDKAPGYDTPGLLARASGLTATLALTERAGHLYLYARNTQGKYSYPAVLEYNKALPPTPEKPDVKPSMGGLSVTAASIPHGCIGMVVHISQNGIPIASIKTAISTISYACDAGVYDVQISYYDLFGEGNLSAVTTVTVKVTISKDMIEDEAISLEKVDKTVADAIAQGNVANEAITSVVAELNKPPEESSYSAITQLSNDVNLRVMKNDVINQINISTEGIKIDGKNVHVTGDTVFDNNVITKGMIQAGAVDATKINVANLSALSATIGTLRTASTGARLEIHDNLIEVFDDNNVLRVRMGVW